ncbi:MAG: hypothetical protein IKN71_04615 [Alphaproteobacteria bacterium]|nr:hypothetical protein [Alphaproteobacteria bacterium]
MSIEEKIAKVRDKAAKLVVKAAAVATLLGGAGTTVSCSENNRDTDENKNKIEKAENIKTSVVSKANHGLGRATTYSEILLEDGTYIHGVEGEKRFLEEGDTVTYETQEKWGKTDNIIQSVKYKNGNPQVNFDKNQETGKNGNRIDNVEGEKTSVVFRANHGLGRNGISNEILLENGSYIAGIDGDKRFLEEGDTITYETRKTLDERYPTHTIKKIKYKNGNPQVDFDKNRDTGKDWDKIAETNGEKTSVVFRANHGAGSIGASNEILLEDGSYIRGIEGDKRFLEKGDTITYETQKKSNANHPITTIKKIKYKDGNNEVNFDKNRDTDKDWDKIAETNGEKTSVVFRANHGAGSMGISNEMLLEDGSYIKGIEDDKKFIEEGDTITYETHKKWDASYPVTTIKAVKHKEKDGKQVDFNKIVKLGKDITD